jgi:hypothetical protein
MSRPRLAPAGRAHLQASIPAPQAWCAVEDPAPIRRVPLGRVPPTSSAARGSAPAACVRWARTRRPRSVPAGRAHLQASIPALRGWNAVPGRVRIRQATPDSVPPTRSAVQEFAPAVFARQVPMSRLRWAWEARVPVKAIVAPLAWRAVRERAPIRQARPDRAPSVLNAVRGSALVASARRVPMFRPRLALVGRARLQASIPASRVCSVVEGRVHIRQARPDYVPPTASAVPESAPVAPAPRGARP